MKYLILVLLGLTALNACKSSSRIENSKLSTVPEVKAPEMQVQVQEKKFVFDISDKENLDKCGGSDALKLLAQNQVKSIASPFEIFISDIIIPLSDPMSVDNYYRALQPEYLNKQIFDFVIQPSSKQKVDHQSFWKFLTTNQKAIEHTLVNRQKNEKDIAQIRFTLFVRSHELSSVDKVEAGGTRSYKVSGVTDAQIQYAISFEPKSAHWFKVTAEKIAQCMEDGQLAATGNSRDSIQAYLVAMLFEQRTSKIKAALNDQFVSSGN